MTLQNETQVANTRGKLERLEARYETLRNETGVDQRLKELSMTSLKRLINQFKEEIARFNVGATNGRKGRHEVSNEDELTNTRMKLSRLEESYEAMRQETGDNVELRELTMKSLKRYINQFKEEIARYELQESARRK